MARCTSRHKDATNCPRERVLQTQGKNEQPPSTAWLLPASALCVHLLVTTGWRKIQKNKFDSSHGAFRTWVHTQCLNRAERPLLCVCPISLSPGAKRMLINAPWRGGSGASGQRRGQRPWGGTHLGLQGDHWAWLWVLWGKKEKMRVSGGEMQLLPRHHFKIKLYLCSAQATTQGGWPHSVAPIPCDILHLLPHPHEEGG